MWPTPSGPAVTVGVRPVTDTVKELARRGTSARPSTATACSRSSRRWCCRPPWSAALDGVPTTDFAALVAALAERFPVETLEAPAEARRVADEADLRVLEALTAPAGPLGR